MKFIVIIPTYNEYRNIRELVRQIVNIFPAIEILIIDDNSTDGTFEEVVRLQNNYSNLKVRKRNNRLGFSSACIEGFRFALDNKYDAIIQMDADLSHSPIYIPQMLGLLKEYDLIIGSRYVEGGSVLNCPFGRILLSRLANIFTNILLGLPINDLTSGYKCIKRSVLEGIDFSKISSKGYVFQIEMIFRAFLKGYKITELPISFTGRTREKSKMSLWIVLEAFLRVLSFAAIRLERLIP